MDTDGLTPEGRGHTAPSAVWGAWGPRLAAYQIDFVRDPSRKKQLIKSRRIGGSRALAADSCGGAAGYDWATGTYDANRAENEYLISSSQDQSEQLLAEALDVGRQLERCLGAYQHALHVLVQSGTQYTYEDLDYAAERYLDAGYEFQGTLIADANTDEIKFTTGKSIYARPANEHTARGWTGNLRFDEMGSMPRGREIWRAAKPITDKNWRNPLGYKLSVTGTPLGDEGIFYDLACTDAGISFSRHWIDIYRAVADGFPVNPDELREEAGDEDMYLQEYCTVFLSAKTRYITSDLLDSAACSYREDSRQLIDAIKQVGPDRIRSYGGLDVAISQRGDNSSYVSVIKVGSVYWVKPDIWYEQGASFKTQKSIVGAELTSNVATIAMDATGIGASMAEDLTDTYGSRVIPVNFGLQVKADLVTRLKKLLSEGRLKIPVGAHQLRRDILALRRTQTAAGNVVFDVERSRIGKRQPGKVGGGHGDSAWALALALYAAEQGPGNTGPVWVVPVRGRYRAKPRPGQGWGLSSTAGTPG